MMNVSDVERSLLLVKLPVRGQTVGSSIEMPMSAMCPEKLWWDACDANPPWDRRVTQPTSCPS